MKPHLVTSLPTGFLVDEAKLYLRQVSLWMKPYPITSPQIGFLVDETTFGNFTSDRFPCG